MIGQQIRNASSRRQQWRARAAGWIAALAAFSVLCGCNVGPKYAKPSAPTPASFKELTPETEKDLAIWKQAQPKDEALKGKWWEAYSDPDLNALEEQVSVSNQSLAASYASYLAAIALVKQARSQLFPTVALSGPTITEQQGSLGGRGGSSGASSSGTTGTSSPGPAFTSYSVAANASWQPDLWGRVRNTIHASAYAAQAGAADLENTRLSLQGELAVDYYSLRGQDALKTLFDETVSAFQEALELTQARFETGIDPEETVAQARTQLETARAQDTNLGIARAQFEHAIALLVGKPASSFSIPAKPLQSNPPLVPLGLPSQLLERRPDVAAAERLMAQANAQIGVARAAYFPTVTLGASGGFASTSIADWFTWPSRFWSVGPALAETIFDAGLRRATTQQFQAQYLQAVANYRSAVLTAFQQVEDRLAELHYLSEGIQQQDAAVQAAQRNLTLANDRYRLGIDPYLNVITAQTTLFTNQQAAVTLRTQLMTASVNLIEALGGGWDASKLPSEPDIILKPLQVPKPSP